MRKKDCHDSYQFSKATLEKAETARKYIEGKYSAFIRELQSRKEQVDRLQQKMDELALTSGQRQEIWAGVTQHRSAELRRRRCKLSLADYQLLDVIGRGSFGEVRLCRDKQSKELVAIKRLKKSEMVRRNQIFHVRLEREVLAANRSDYIVGLLGCFQDATYLYFVMEYLPGGDFMSLLVTRDVLTESETRFYLVQLILAIEEIHRRGYIHRDIKPDNILIGGDGFIKLTDFGLDRNVQLNAEPTPLTKLQQASRKQLHEMHKKVTDWPSQRVLSRVGTPQYIAPEVFGEGSYDQSIDWWSVGIVMFESLFGGTPFADDDPKRVCSKIVEWDGWIDIPTEPKISLEALSLLQGLLCPKPFRLGLSNIKQHPFFIGVDWERASQMTPPFVPLLRGQTDVSYFEGYSERELWIADNAQHPTTKDYNFAVFDYRRMATEPPEDVAQTKLQELVKKRKQANQESSPRNDGKPIQKKIKFRNSLHKTSTRLIRRSHNPPSNDVEGRQLKELDCQILCARLFQCEKQQVTRPKGPNKKESTKLKTNALRLRTSHH